MSENGAAINPINPDVLASMARRDLLEMGIVPQVVDELIASARARSEKWLRVPPGPDFAVPHRALPAFMEQARIDGRRFADAFGTIIHMEAELYGARRDIERLKAEIHHMNFGFGPPTDTMAERPVLSVIEGGKADGTS